MQNFVFLLSIFMKNHILWPPARAKKTQHVVIWKQRKPWEFSRHMPHETRATPPNISFFWNGKRDTGDTGKRDTQDRGHTEHKGTQGTQGTQGIQGTHETGDTRDTGNIRDTKDTGDTGKPRPQGAFPSPTGPKNGKKKEGSIGPCFTLCIFTFCLHLCLAKGNERLWHYHRIWKRFLCG